MTGTLTKRERPPFVNRSGEEIPAFAPMAVMDTHSVVSETPIIDVEKPQTAESREIVVNSPIAVPASSSDPKCGQYTDAHSLFFARIEEDVEAGDIVEAGENWTFEKSGSGRFICSVVSSEDDGFGWVYRKNSSDVQIVKMVKVGGDNGTKETMNTYIYDVVDRISGEVIEAGVTVPYSGDPNRRHDFQTQELGQVDPARRALIYRDQENENELIIFTCDEQNRVGACDDDSGGSIKLVRGSGRYDVTLNSRVLSIQTLNPSERDNINAVILVDDIEHFNGWFPAPGRVMRIPQGNVVAELTTYDSNGDFIHESVYSTSG